LNGWVCGELLDDTNKRLVGWFWLWLGSQSFCARAGSGDLALKQIGSESDKAFLGQSVTDAFEEVV
jgi:hypothetical protein